MTQMTQSLSVSQNADTRARILTILSLQYLYLDQISMFNFLFVARVFKEGLQEGVQEGVQESLLGGAHAGALKS